MSCSGLFWNAGPSQKTEFVLMTEKECGPDLFQPMVGRGAAYADIDSDGDLDILETACGRAPRLLRNESPKGPHWVRFALRGKQSNRDAIGAVVTITAGGKKQSRIVSPTRSYQSQCEKVVTFGLGAHEKIESATIRWPGGSTQSLESIEIDRVIAVEQPAP